MHDGRLTKLQSLIEEELAERGQLTTFLNNLVPLSPLEPAQLSPVRPNLEAVSSSSISSEPEVGISDAHLPANGLTEQVSRDANCSCPSELHDSNLACIAAAESASQQETACSNDPASHSIGVNEEAPAASHSPSVLEAAIAAYKQEKRQLWKASAQAVSNLFCTFKWLSVR